MTTTPDHDCSSCRWWQPFGKDGDGLCRVNPPTVNMLDALSDCLDAGIKDYQDGDPLGWLLSGIYQCVPLACGSWPRTDCGDWCGRWEPKP